MKNIWHIKVNGTPFCCCNIGHDLNMKAWDERVVLTCSYDDHAKGMKNAQWLQDHGVDAILHDGNCDAPRDEE